MNSLFEIFLSQMSLKGAHCMDCLSQMYGEPAAAVMGYVNAMGLVGRPAQCSNCGEHRSTFRRAASSAA